MADQAWINELHVEFGRYEGVREGFLQGRQLGDLSSLAPEDWPSRLVPRVLPKTIWMYWAQGWDKAPNVVLRCRDTWIRRNPQWNVLALDDETAVEHHDLTKRLEGKTLSLNHKADFLRMNLLKDFGGVWADATTVCSQPLDNWLPLLMQSGFFAFSRPRPDRVLANWFLASEKDGVLMERWLALCNRYWDAISDTKHYFWMHYLFAHGCRTDRTIAAGWDATPHLSAHGALLPSDIQQPGYDARAVYTTAALNVPVYKLSHKHAPGSEEEKKMLLFLG